MGEVEVRQHLGFDQVDGLAGVARLDRLVLTHDGDHVVGDAFDEGVRRDGVGEGSKLDAEAEGQRGKQGEGLGHSWLSFVAEVGEGVAESAAARAGAAG